MYEWSITDDASDNDLAIISGGVIGYGRSLAVDGNANSLDVFLRDDKVIVAGATGRTEYNRLFVNYLWVSEKIRRKGFGSKVLTKLEHAAMRRGCNDVLLETIGDDTAQFYFNCGYFSVARVPKYVGEFSKYILLKNFLNNLCVVSIFRDDLN